MRLLKLLGYGCSGITVACYVSQCDLRYSGSMVVLKNLFMVLSFKVCSPC